MKLFFSYTPYFSIIILQSAKIQTEILTVYFHQNKN